MNTPRHNGRVVVVTGGGSGIGLATAGRFAIEGASVYIVGRDEARLAKACRQLEDAHSVCVRPLPGDVSDPSSMKAAAAEVSAQEDGVDVIVNNAGLASPSTPTEDEDFITDLWDRLSIDVMGTAVTTAAFAPLLRRGGSVLNMGSVYATTAARGAASYSAAKGAIIGLTRTLAVELGPRGIRVNCVSPGWVDVPKWEDYFAKPTLEHLRGDFARVPLRAPVTVDEIAALYAYLAHEDAGGISGQDIVVDRGMSADLYVTPTVPGLA